MAGGRGKASGGGRREDDGGSGPPPPRERGAGTDEVPALRRFRDQVPDMDPQLKSSILGATGEIGKNWIEMMELDGGAV